MTTLQRRNVIEQVWRNIPVVKPREYKPRHYAFQFHRSGPIYQTADEIDFITQQARAGNIQILRTLLAWVDRRRWDLNVDVAEIKNALLAALDGKIQS